MIFHCAVGQLLKGAALPLSDSHFSPSTSFIDSLPPLSPSFIDIYISHLRSESSRKKLLEVTNTGRIHKTNSQLFNSNAIFQDSVGADTTKIEHAPCAETCRLCIIPEPSDATDTGRGGRPDPQFRHGARSGLDIESDKFHVKASHPGVRVKEEPSHRDQG